MLKRDDLLHLRTFFIGLLVLSLVRVSAYAGEQVDKSRVKWKVLTWTADVSEGGTDSDVNVSWGGPYGKTAFLSLETDADDFERNQWDDFWFEGKVAGVGDVGPAMFIDVKLIGSDDWSYQRLVVERWVDGVFQQRSNFNELGALGDYARNEDGTSGKWETRIWVDGWDPRAVSSNEVEETVYHQVWVSDQRDNPLPTPKKIKDTYEFSQSALREKIRSKTSGYEVSVKTEGEIYPGIKATTTASASQSKTDTNTDKVATVRSTTKTIEAEYTVPANTLVIRTLIAKVKGKHRRRTFQGSDYHSWTFNPSTVWIAYDHTVSVPKGQPLTEEQEAQVAVAKTH